MVLILLSAFVSARITRRKKKQTTGKAGWHASAAAGSAEQRFATRKQTDGIRTEKETVYSDDVEKRLRHLDDWLKSGLIDKNEYKVLKERYLRQR